MSNFITSILFLTVLSTSLFYPACTSQSNLAKTKIRQHAIDSIFSAAENAGLNTHNRLKYIYRFSDRERIPIQEMAGGLEKDSIKVIHIYSAGNRWHVSAYENATHSRSSIEEQEKDFRWMMYKYKVDQYDGFSILPADIDYTVISDSEFLPFLQSLSDEDLFNVADQLSEANDHLKAISAYEELLERNVYEDTSHYRMGAAWIGIHEYVEGIGHWEKSLEHNPAYLEVHMDLGKIFFENSHWKKAYKHFAAANRIRPNDDVILYHLAKSLIQLERYAEAYLAIRESLKVNRRNIFAKGVLKQLRSPAMRKLRSTKQ